MNSVPKRIANTPMTSTSNAAPTTTDKRSRSAHRSTGSYRRRDVSMKVLR